MERVNEKGTDRSDSWEPVCAVRDKPEKRNLAHSGKDLVHSGRGKGESCF